MCNSLYIFVEGNDDEKFFEKIFKPYLEKKYIVHFYKYQNVKHAKVNDFIKNIKICSHIEYIFIRDFDSGPCVSRKKADLLNDYQNLESKKIVLVKKCIEGWYLAGYNVTKKKFKDSENITKYFFENLDIVKRDSLINIKNTILEKYCLKKALKENRSLKYFFDKYCN